MAKTKSELEYDYDRHQAIVIHSRRLAASGAIHEALNVATSALVYVDGMIQYERRYRNRMQLDTIDCIDLIITYAPIIFDIDKLDQVEMLLRSQRRVEKNTVADLSRLLLRAREKMLAALRIWNLLEEQNELRENEIAKNVGWREIVIAWEEMGITRWQSTAMGRSLVFVTQLDAEAVAKCPTCGHLHRTRKLELLGECTCEKCQIMAPFVLTSRSGDVS